MRHYDLEKMLYEDMEWLIDRLDLSKSEFEELARKLELDQVNWSRFWSRIGDKLAQDETKFKCIILGRERDLTPEEFELAKRILWTPLKRDGVFIF